MGGENCLKWILSSHLQLGSKQCLRVPNMQWWEYVAIVLARNNIKHLSSIKHFKKFKSLHFKSLLFFFFVNNIKSKNDNCCNKFNCRRKSYTPCWWIMFLYEMLPGTYIREKLRTLNWKRCKMFHFCEKRKLKTNHHSRKSPHHEPIV